MKILSTTEPDYNNIILAAKNQKPSRIPRYEHSIDIAFMEKYYGYNFGHLLQGNYDDKLEFMKHYTGFYKNMGYDTVSYECLIGRIMPGSGALDGSVEGVIKNRQDFELYPFDDLPDLFFNAYDEELKALAQVMPQGMKAIGGPGNGIFECVQDLVGYTNLCYIQVDDPELYQDLFRKIGEVFVEIWSKFMKDYRAIYCVLRFGDDLGYKMQTLISHNDIRKHIIPQYRKITDIVHAYEMPFLLHSCGNIFEVMDDLIQDGRIDAKHSNEDQIAPFSEWVDRYGHTIGNFGGIDVNALCQLSVDGTKDYVRGVLEELVDKKGIAIGSGNSIPSYVPVDNYLAMIEVINEY